MDYWIAVGIFDFLHTIRIQIYDQILIWFNIIIGYDSMFSFHEIDKAVVTLCDLIRRLADIGMLSRYLINKLFDIKSAKINHDYTFQK